MILNIVLQCEYRISRYFLIVSRLLTVSKKIIRETITCIFVFLTLISIIGCAIVVRRWITTTRSSFPSLHQFTWRLQRPVVRGIPVTIYAHFFHYKYSELKADNATIHRNELISTYLLDRITTRNLCLHWKASLLIWPRWALHNIIRLARPTSSMQWLVMSVEFG